MGIFGIGREEEIVTELELACDPKMNLSMRSGPLWRRCCSVLQEDSGFGPFYAYNSLSPQPWHFSDHHYEFTTILFSFIKELLQRICMKLLAKMNVAHTPTPLHRVTRHLEIEMHGRASEVDVTDCVDDATVSAKPRVSKEKVIEMDPLSVTPISTSTKSVVHDDAITNLDLGDQQLQGVTGITIVENHNKRAISSRSKRGRRKRLIGLEDLEKSFSLISEENANSSND